MRLTDFFKENPSVALGFSGGVDSAYLLYAALESGAAVGAYFVKTQFQPAFELEDALALADGLGARISVLECDILSQAQVAENPPNRCYHCKRRIFEAIAAQAAHDGYPLIIDGTNASDDVADRPGVAALRELSVRSPLLECGITKPQLRQLSREAGLFTWDKPAYACLATRIPHGEIITGEKLALVEKNEALLYGLGFSDLRLRLRGDCAVLELPESQLPKARDSWNRISALLGDFEHVELVKRSS